MSHIAERRISRPMTALRIGFATLAAPATLFFGARAAVAETPLSQSTPTSLRGEPSQTTTISTSDQRRVKPEQSDGVDPMLPLGIVVVGGLIILANLPFSDSEGPPRQRRSDARFQEEMSRQIRGMSWRRLRDDPKFGGSMSPEMRERVFGDLDDNPTDRQ